MSHTPGRVVQAALLLAEETARGALPPEEPGVIRLLSGVGWRLDRMLAPGRHARMAEEVRRTFGGNDATVAQIVREAHDVGLQARLEALLLSRMDDTQLDRVVRLQPNIRALGGPAWVVYPHAGNLLAMVTALARRAEGLVLFGRREARPGCGVCERRWLRRREEEERLGVTWEEDPTALPRWFQAGRVVAAAFDDRGWGSFETVSLLGRPALLAKGPWSVCEAMGVPVVPVTVCRERDKVNHVSIGAPRPAELERYLRGEAEPFLRAHPGHYAAFLAECADDARGGGTPLYTDG